MSDADSEADLKEEGPSIGVYEGERNEVGERHGKGKNTFPNGDLFEGTYANGKRNGYGIYKWKSGARYVGEYKDNLRSGQGFFIYPDGSKYKGAYLSGKRHGEGTYLYVNNDVYQGSWVNDMRHGTGTYIFSSAGSKKRGQWINGIMEGPGEIIHADHNVSGNFIGGLIDMPAKIKFMNNSKYVKMILDPMLLNQDPVVQHTVENVAPAE